MVAMVLVIQDESLGEGRQMWPDVPWFLEGRRLVSGHSWAGQWRPLPGSGGSSLLWEAALLLGLPRDG